MQGILRGTGTGTKANFDFNVLVELTEYRNHAVDGEPFKPCIADARKLRMRHSRKLFGFTCRQGASVKDADNLRRNDSAGLFEVGICAFEIAENVAAAAYQFKIVVHDKASFNCLRRSRIMSTSMRGVFMPDLDFF